LLHVIALCMLIRFCLREKNLAADATGNLSNICPGFHAIITQTLYIISHDTTWAINSRNRWFLILGKVIFGEAERDFLASNEACRVATCHDDIPHVVPVSYVFEDDVFIFATDYETKKYENISKNNRIALVVDIYSSVGNKAVCVQGVAELIENGGEFARLYKIFHKRFEWVRMDPWKEGEAPFVRVTPTNKISWGL